MMSSKSNQVKKTIQNRRDSGIDTNSVVVDKAVLVEMKKNEATIKELQEKILKLKVNKEFHERSQISLMNMVYLREEMMAADKFIKSVLVDNLTNYDVFLKMEESKEKSKVSKTRILEKFNNDALSKINFDNCKCMTCVMNKSMTSYSAAKKGLSLFSNIKLTDRIFMMTHCDHSKIKMTVINKENKTKELIMKDLITGVEVATVKMIWRKEEDNTKVDIKFNMHPDNFFNVSNMDKTFRVSMSSFLVTKAMREVPNNHLEFLDKMEVLKTLDKPTCFANMFNGLMGHYPVDERATSINDLMEEEEMELLTNVGDNEVFFRIVEENNNNRENHISIEPFDNSIKIKVYMLSTPMMRNINFFADMDMPAVDLSSMDLLENQEENTEVTFDFENNLLEKFFPSLKKEFNIHSGKLIGSFATRKFLDINSNKGINLDMLRELVESNLSNCLFSNPYPKPSHLFLYHIPYSTFLICCLFMNSNTEMWEMIYSSDLDYSFQVFSNLKNVFYDRLMNEYKMNSEEVMKEWKNMNGTIENHMIFANKMYPRMFMEFKKKIFMTIMMWKVSKEQDFENNSMKTRTDINKDKDLIWKSFMFDEKMTMRKMMSYQPIFKVNNKLIDWIRPEILETEGLFLTFMNMEK